MGQISNGPAHPLDTNLLGDNRSYGKTFSGFTPGSQLAGSELTT